MLWLVHASCGILMRDQRLEVTVLSELFRRGIRSRYSTNRISDYWGLFNRDVLPRRRRGPSRGRRGPRRSRTRKR